MNRKVFTAAEAAKYMNIKLNTVYAFSSRGTIPKVKFCGRLMFLKEDIDAFILNGRIDFQTSKVKRSLK